jgi:hypothetical protein
MRKRQNLVISILIALILSLGAFRFYLLDRLNTQSVYLYQIQKETEVLKHDDVVIRQEILRREALTTIAQEASQSGFIQAPILYLPRQ